MFGNWIRNRSISAAWLTTRLIGQHWGEAFPYYYVSEFPKAGGTWLARMVAEYLRIPFPQNSMFPIGCSAVIQNHWRYHPGHKRVFYLWRDGRDVYTSYLFGRMRVGGGPPSTAQRRVHVRNQQIMGKDYLEQDTRTLMLRFLEYEIKKPGLGVRVPWHEHIAQWHRPDERPDIAYLSYEQLREDCFATMKQALELVTQKDVDQWLLESTIQRCSMERMTSRKSGKEDRTQHIRKGVVGDWQNHFTRAAAEAFRDLTGDTLMTLGYEESADWVDRYDLG